MKFLKNFAFFLNIFLVGFVFWATINVHFQSLAWLILVFLFATATANLIVLFLDIIKSKQKIYLWIGLVVLDIICLLPIIKEIVDCVWDYYLPAVSAVILLVFLVIINIGVLAVLLKAK